MRSAQRALGYFLRPPVKVTDNSAYFDSLALKLAQASFQNFHHIPTFCTPTCSLATKHRDQKNQRLRSPRVVDPLFSACGTLFQPLRLSFCSAMTGRSIDRALSSGSPVYHHRPFQMCSDNQANPIGIGIRKRLHGHYLCISLRSFCNNSA